MFRLWNRSQPRGKWDIFGSIESLDQGLSVELKTFSVVKYLGAVATGWSPNGTFWPVNDTTNGTLGVEILKVFPRLECWASISWSPSMVPRVGRAKIGRCVVISGPRSSHKMTCICHISLLFLRAYNNHNSANFQPIHNFFGLGWSFETPSVRWAARNIYNTSSRGEKWHVRKADLPP